MYKVNGSPMDDFNELRRLNPALFSTSGGITTDDFRENAITSGMPARVGHVRDSIAYSTQPTADSWYARRVGTQSPTRPTGTTGIQQSGATLI